MPVGHTDLVFNPRPATDFVTSGGKRRNAADSDPDALVA